MEKLRVRTKFNTTGWRVLRIPLDDKEVCAPANRRYRRRCRAIQAEFKKNMYKPWEAYIQRMTEVLASYVGSKSASKEDRFRIVKCLAEGRLTESGVRPELGDIPDISKEEQEAWATYVEEDRRVYGKWEEDLKKASYEHGVEKRALWREITDHIHHQYHPEDKKKIKSGKGEIRKFNISKGKSGESKESKKLEELQDRFAELKHGEENGKGEE